MAALAAPDRAGFLAWMQRGIELARSGDGSARYWLGPLLNNVGWEHYEAGEYADAVDAFRRALEERSRDPENEAAIEIARFAVGKTLRAMGRSHQAVPLLEQAVAWTESTRAPDGWFHEELAEEYGRARARERRARAGKTCASVARRGGPRFREGSRA